jgi:hypothetical protein
MMEPWTEADDVVEEVREIRRRISAELDDDPAKIVAHYIEYQKQFGDRLVVHAPGDEKDKTAA